MHWMGEQDRSLGAAESISKLFSAIDQRAVSKQLHSYKCTEIPELALE